MLKQLMIFVLCLTSVIARPYLNIEASTNLTQTGKVIIYKSKPSLLIITTCIAVCPVEQTVL